MLFLLFLLLPPFSSQLNVFVYVNIPGKSHLDFANTLVEKLAERGHEVDLAMARLNPAVLPVASPAARHVIDINFPSSPWTHSSHLNSPFLDNPLEHQRVFTSIADFNLACEALCECVLNSTELEEHLSSHVYDVALVTAYDLCPHALMHHHGVKKVLTFSPLPFTSWMSLFSGVPNLPAYRFDVIHSFNPFDPFSLIDRMYNFLRLVVTDVLDAATMTANMETLFRSRFGPSFPSPAELGHRVAYEFVNSAELLDTPRPTSSRLRFIGGINVKPAKKITDEYYKRALNGSDAGVVVVSFGSLVPGANYPQNVIDAFLATFAAFSRYTFLWRFAGAKRPAAATANVHTVEWLPQNDLLNDPRIVAFISHVGMNSFMEATTAGVPLVAVPLFADQNYNGDVVERLGTGVRVRKDHLNNESLSDALGTVLRDERFRIRSREVAEMLRRQPATPTRTFIETLEFAAHFEELHRHTLLDGAKLRFWQHYGYDAVVLMTLLALLFSFFAYRLLFSVANSILNIFFAKIKRKLD